MINNKNSFIKFSTETTGGSTEVVETPTKPIVTPTPTPQPIKPVEPEIKIEVDIEAIIKNQVEKKVKEMSEQMMNTINTSTKIQQIEKSIPEDKKALWNNAKENMTNEQLLTYFEKSKTFFLPNNGDYSGGGLAPATENDPYAIYKNSETGKLYGIDDKMISFSDPQKRAELGKKLLAKLEINRFQKNINKNILSDLIKDGI